MPYRAAEAGDSRSHRRRYWHAQRIRVNGRLVAPLPEGYHGKRHTYNYYGCQCDLCAKANRDGQRQRSSPTPARHSTVATPAFVAPEVPEQARAETRQKRQPAKRAKRKPEPPEVPDFGVEIPEVTREVRAEITTVDQLRDVLAAYHTPQWRVGLPNQPGWERRSAHGCSLIVNDAGVVVFIGTADQSTAAPETLREQAAPKSSKRGGCGTTLPTSYAEVIERLKELGCTVDASARHLAVTLPDGQRRTLPKTASDWRSVKNTVAQFRADGLDLRRK